MDYYNYFKRQYKFKLKKMKQLLFTIFVILGLTLNAQEKKNDITTTQTERIIDKYSDKIIDGFNNTIDKVTPMAEEGFAIIVKLKFIEGVAYLLPFIIGIILLILSTIRFKKIRYVKELPKEYITENNTYGFIYLIVGGIIFIIGLLTLSTALTHIFVPEWYAIKEIMNLI